MANLLPVYENKGQWEKRTIQIQDGCAFYKQINPGLHLIELFEGQARSSHLRSYFIVTKRPVKRRFRTMSHTPITVQLKPVRSGASRLGGPVVIKAATVLNNNNTIIGHSLRNACLSELFKNNKMGLSPGISDYLLCCWKCCWTAQQNNIAVDNA